MPRTANALDLLRQDHQRVLALFKQVEKTEDEKEQRQLCREIVEELSLHAQIEESVFYPFLREATDREDLFEEASIEHEAAKDLLERLRTEDPGTPRFHAIVKVLKEYVQHHVQEEESEIFPQVAKTGIDLEALGEEIAERKAAGLDGGAAGEHAEPARSRPSRSKPPTGPSRKAKGQAHADYTGDDEQYLEEHAGELSRSTERAKWIHRVGEGPDHDGQTLATRNPEVIRQWAEARGGRPATSAGGDAKRPRVLRFDFPDYDKGLQEVSWDDWLRTFEERELVFVYQETMKAGNQSNFFRLDSPHREEG